MQNLGTNNFYEELIINYTSQNNLLTYDPYDIWKTKIGLIIKSYYYKNRILSIPFAGALTIFDLFINNNLRIFYKKQEYPIVRALAALSLINLSKSTNNDTYLKYASVHIKWLLENFSQSVKGIGWGLGFKWPVGKNLIYSDRTPFSTHTPYSLEAFFFFSKQVKDYDFNSIYEMIYLFYENDIKIMYEDEKSLAISYGPVKDRIATNATSYGLFVYSLFYILFPDRKNYIKNKAQKLYNFIVINQGDEGEWLYTPKDYNSFIDCFHSCFILQNLIKAKQAFPEFIREDVIIKGWNYVTRNFFDEDTGLYKRFAKKNKFGLIKFDLYDNAEVLSTAILLKDYEVVSKLLPNILKTFLIENEIYSGVTHSGRLVNKNTLRWAVMPFIHSLSLYLSNNVWNSGNY